MTPEDENVRNLSKLIAAMNQKAMTHEEFVKAFEVVMETIQELRLENQEDFRLMQEAMDALGEQLRERASQDIEKACDEFDSFAEKVRSQISSIVARVDDRLEDLKDIKNGETPTDAHLMELMIPLLPDVQAIDEMGIVNTVLDKVEDRLPEFGKAFRDALELLPEGEKLTPDAIEGLQDHLEKTVHSTGTRAGWGAHPLMIKDGATVVAKVARVINFGTNLTATLGADGTITVNASGGGSGGYTVETPTGTVDGSNKTFTVSTTPVYIVVDGITYFDGSGYSIVGTTVTTVVAPTGFIRSFYS